MIVEKVDSNLDEPFVTITFTKRGVLILKELVRYNPTCLQTDFGVKLNVPHNANEIFSFPLCQHLQDIGL